MFYNQCKKLQTISKWLKSITLKWRWEDFNLYTFDHWKNHDRIIFVIYLDDQLTIVVDYVSNNNIIFQKHHSCFKNNHHFIEQIVFLDKLFVYEFNQILILLFILNFVNDNRWIANSLQQ